ncbi:Tetraacyldisaccharide 4'-kinase [Durusdinium trenchii]|uniref:Tetraacyldisaccharide 4'-kinase n=1 Tax=Durusdinium trenchii TaxID=1381693 RepID=A0ABP0SE32_9DINO
MGKGRRRARGPGPATAKGRKGATGNARMGREPLAAKVPAVRVVDRVTQTVTVGIFPPALAAPSEPAPEQREQEQENGGQQQIEKVQGFGREQDEEQQQQEEQVEEAQTQGRGGLAGEFQMVRQRLERQVLYQDVIFAVQDVLTPAECAAWISFGERVGFAEAKQAATTGFAHRDNGRIAVHDADIARRIFDRMREMVPAALDNGKKAVGCSKNIRLYRYHVGQRFGKHIDESNFEEDAQAWSEFTLLFYLNDLGLQGGETVFFKGNTGASEVLRVTPVAGQALLHWHGDRCLLHEGANVRAGVKYLLRTDVLYR